MVPDISVIIPVYNVEKWLRECLDSVCGQSLRNIEIICINDGSSDRSLDIMKEYAARDDRICIIDKQNEGVGAARNDGIRVARGEFVAFMDPDDKYPNSDTLRLLFDAAKKHGVHIVGGYLGAMDDKGNPVAKDRSYFGVDFSCAGIVRYAEFQCDLQFTAYIYHREFLIQYGLFFPNYARFQDPPFFARVMTSATVFFAVDQITYVYRVGTGKPVLGYKKVHDMLCGLTDNLRLSEDKHYARLHYLSAMRLLTDASYLVGELRENDHFCDLVWQYIKTAGMINEQLIAEDGYALPEPVLPRLFTEMIEESRDYRSLMKHKSVRVIRKLIART